MAMFISTLKFTPQGVGKIQDTCRRASAFKAAARKMGVKVQEIYWALGPYDGFIVFDAPDEETATALMLHLSSAGNVQTQTARVYKAAEMEAILGKLSG